MAKAALGQKRVCLHCGARFYDLNKQPIVCPSCGTTFEPEAFVDALLGDAEDAAA